MTAHFTITNASSLDPRNRRQNLLSVFECECTGDICQYGHLDIHQEIVKKERYILGKRYPRRFHGLRPRRRADYRKKINPTTPMSLKRHLRRRSCERKIRHATAPRRDASAWRSNVGEHRLFKIYHCSFAMAITSGTPHGKPGPSKRW